MNIRRALTFGLALGWFLIFSWSWSGLIAAPQPVNAQDPSVPGAFQTADGDMGTFLTKMHTPGLNGSTAGTGTFTAVDGTKGMLALIAAKPWRGMATGFNFTSAANALTRRVRLVERAGGRAVSQQVDLGLLARATTHTATRFNGTHHPHCQP